MLSFDRTIQLAMELISKPSITPKDMGCQQVLTKRLAALGFKIELLRFGNVDNFWARFGTKEPLFIFAGHTDVVPPGNLALWHSPPFNPIIRNGYLYGRGAADMKSSLAAMVIACENLLSYQHRIRGSIAFLITSDEEGTALDGTAKVLKVLEARGEKITWCLIGEPTCSRLLGDTIKNGRRGSLNGQLVLIGKQGHIAYPHLCRNPVHAVWQIIMVLTQTIWDQANNVPSTNFQISNIHAGTGAKNMVPSSLEIHFNFRFSQFTNVDWLKEHTNNIIKQNLIENFQYELNWDIPSYPFLTKTGNLLTSTVKAISQVTNLHPVLSTDGGTSDGRFIAQTGAEVIEFGHQNSSIHQVNECVSLNDIPILSKIYEQIMLQLMY